jgi:hypothetical protein
VMSRGMKELCIYDVGLINTERRAGGCYMGTLAPGALTSFFHVIRDPIANGRIHFAGTETVCYCLMSLLLFTEFSTSGHQMVRIYGRCD